MTSRGPLTGIHVVDFTHVLAGPACAYYLSLLGADVIKVERAGRGDAMRHRGGTDRTAMAEGMSTAYRTQAAGKRSIALDLESDTGREVMDRLLARADVLVENHRPQTMAALGLDDAAIAERYPRLLHCAMTGYGRGGPREDAAAYDVNIQAVCGIMTMTGTAESGPTRTGAPIMDYGTALAAGFAITSALWQREKTGRGGLVDVSMLETAFTLMSAPIVDYLATGTAPKPRGNSANSRSPGAGTFPCREGSLSLGVNEEAQFRALATTIGREAWLTDERFADRNARRDHAGELEADLADLLLMRTAGDWERDLVAAGVPAAQMRSLPDALALDDVAARAFFQAPAGADQDKSARLPTLPFRLNGARSAPPSGPAPRLGEHTRVILEELGYSAEQASEIAGEASNHS